MTNIHEDDFGGAFPFKSKYHDTANGRMAYIDEGKGQPVVMLHGNPTWSYIYRNFIPLPSSCLKPIERAGTFRGGIIGLMRRHKI